MRILYIGNHGQENSNQDEEAITYALSQLGHDVQRLHECHAHQWRRVPDRELVLFHKWDNPAIISEMRIAGLKTVFWYFDLVNWPGDATLKRRCDQRLDWMRRTIPVVDLGFCTDGDWVAHYNEVYGDRLVRLTQGADNRIIGYGQEPVADAPALLFTGTPNGGVQRRSFVDEMQITYRQTFNCVNGVYREELKNLIAGSKICIAPDSPVTDRYWSNRVYNTMGFGGFMLHPYGAELAKQFEEDDEIVFYHNREELHQQIRFYYNYPEDMKRIAQNGLIRVQNEHTYLHRCSTLMSTIAERLF